MEVIRARVLGYCMGVQRAVEEAEKSLEEYGAKCKVYSLGPLIHNPRVIADFERKGLCLLDSHALNKIDSSSSVVIIRAHGTTPEVLASLSKKGVRVVDATCPKVHLSQKRAREFAEKGYTLVLAGDRNHGEVISICGYAENARPNSTVVVQNAGEAEKLSLKEPVMLLAQTTFSPCEYERITKVIKEKCPEAVVFNSICSATMERQKALAELKGLADGIIVIGGKNSANTKRLFESAKLICENVCLVEDEKEIPENFYSLKKVALTAGASTPLELVSRVEERLLSKGK